MADTPTNDPRDFAARAKLNAGLKALTEIDKALDNRSSKAQEAAAKKAQEAAKTAKVIPLKGRKATGK